MINQKFYQGLESDPTDRTWPKEIVPFTINGKTRYICTYEDGKRYKGKIFDLLKKHGQTEVRKTWDLHHIVEGQHYADIDFMGRLEIAYKKELPCVLIANEEHRALNSLLHCKETDELWRDIALPSNLKERSRATAKAARDRSNTSALKKRLREIRNLYINAYSGRPILRQIAMNVIADADHKLR